MLFLKCRKTDADRAFGPDAMRRVKVCPGCGAAASADKRRCPVCGARLPGETVYQTWISRQPRCGGCGAPVSPADHYCPRCGARLPAAAAGEKKPC
jgi:predicted amidophosphoribosyltransferase